MVARKIRAKPGPLATYRAKRDFSRTPEPSGATVAPGHRLIVQHHFATRDHYDLRLETDGVLKSWAVTRGPSADPHDRRLAVRTEDHPLDYATFEGLIPKGQYGGGTVILWEYTTFTPLNGDPGDAIDKGEIKFLAHGARMRGRWVLVRMKTKEKRENWLLIKERDEFAEDDDGLTARFPDSVSTERSREEIERGISRHETTPLPLVGRGGGRGSGDHRKGSPTPHPTGEIGEADFCRPPPQAGREQKRPALPAFVPPQLCTQVETPPEGADWLHELKYDGYRLQLAVAGGKARLYTRSGLDWTQKFGAVAADAASLKCRSALIDGEAIVMNAKGVSDFPGLVAALEQHRAGDIVLMAFDLLELDGADLRARPLRERKKKLAALLKTAGRNIRFATHIEGDGKATFDAAVAAGAEGIIAKRADAPYRSGRTLSWLKIKGYPRTDVLIVGYKPSTKHELFASLHAALEESDELRYIGGIGTGFSDEARKAIFAKLKADAGPQPANLRGEIPRGLKFLRTPLRAEIRFGGWTGSGQLRQARFLALREDLPVPKTTTPANLGRKATTAAPSADEKPVVITHPDRVVYPQDGVTKGEVADYYDAVADRILRYLKDRPVSIVRAPDNIGETFFQRHPLKGMSRGIIEIPQAGGDSYMALDGALGLRTAAQFGAIELHGWMSRLDRIDYPDRLVFDLDPDEAMPFAEVKNAARQIAGHLEDVGLKSWPMISGGKGVHVVVPLDRSLPFEETEIFAEGFARGLAEQAPEKFVANMSKARRKGKIFVDWLRNKRAATAILPWSLRARKGATVAVPLSWDGLARVKSATAYDIRSARKRSDPWDDFFKTKQTIPKAALDFMRRR
jgi:bifunctional non-homologous end joining protein LigD